MFGKNFENLIVCHGFNSISARPLSEKLVFRLLKFLLSNAISDDWRWSFHYVGKDKRFNKGHTWWIENL